MRRNHAQGFEDDGPLPPMGPEGIPGAYDQKLTPPPPRLCEAGPCRHYHRFAIQLDVEGPKADSIEPGGKMNGAAPKQPFHVRVHHYCYPTVGVETELESLPVLQCNRWDPITPREQLELDQKREDFLQRTEAGAKYRAELAAWESARAAERELEDDELALWVLLHVRDGDQIEIRRFVSDKPTELLEQMDADTARAFLSTASIRTRYGVGRFDVFVMRTIDGVTAVGDAYPLEVK